MIDLSRLLVIGRDSAIGQELNFGIKLSHKELDVTNSSQVREIFLKYNPSAVLYLASIDIRNSEKDPPLAFEVNVIGLHNIITEASKSKIKIIIISSGAVFSGPINEVFSEISVPEPLNIYGKTKYLAELLLQQAASDHLIIRTGWLFGFRHKKSGFTKFIDLLLESNDLSKISATKDSIGSPTYLKDFIKSMEDLIRSGSKGIYHLVNEGSASAYDIAGEIAHLTKKKNNVQEINSVFNISPGIPQRSRSEAMRSDKLKLRPWKEALKEYTISSNST